MQATYQIADTTVETTDKPHPKTRAREVEKAFQDLLDVNVNLVEKMTPPAHIDMYGKQHVGITLDMSTWANKKVRNGFDYFSLDKNLPDYFGESTGSANVTGQVLEKNLTLEQVVTILLENGDIEKAIEKIHNEKKEGDPANKTILAYAFLKYSLGWDAERIMRDSGDFKKGNTAQDQGGIDGWWYGQERQIKPGTEYPSNKKTMEDSGKAHTCYLWDMRGGLKVADLDEYQAMKHELADKHNLPYTTIDQSNSLKKNGLPKKRRFRFFWW